MKKTIQILTASTIMGFLFFMLVIIFVPVESVIASDMIGPGGGEDPNAPDVAEPISVSSGPHNSTLLLITFDGNGTWAPDSLNLHDNLVSLGYTVTHLYNPTPGVIASTLNPLVAWQNFKQVWLFDINNGLQISTSDAAAIATWYANNAKGNVIIDARSYGSWYTPTAEIALTANYALALDSRCGGLWIGVDNAPSWTNNGNSVLTAMGYGTVSGSQGTVTVGTPVPTHELLTNPNTINLAGIHAFASPGIPPAGVQPDGTNLQVLLHNTADSHTPLVSFALESDFCSNQPPVADADGPYSGDEGSPIILDGNGSYDPDGDPLTFAWSVDSPLCTFDDPSSPTPTLTCDDNGAFTVTVVVDDGEFTDSNTSTVSVANVAPELENVSLTTPINEDDYATLSGDIVDPGILDFFELDVNWGDGSPLETFTYPAGTTSFSESHQYLDDNPSGTPSDDYTVSMTIIDKDGGATAYGGGGAGPKIVGYYDMVMGYGYTTQVSPITAAGHTPVQIFDLTPAELAGIDILFVQNPSNGNYGAEYLSHLADIQAAVDNGMVLIIHDRFVTLAETILPGGAAFNIIRETYDAYDIDVLDPSSIVANGPGGIVTNTTLDGGTLSNHGFAVLGSLPGTGHFILSRSDPTEIVTFSYPFGDGNVVYSSIPLDYYLAGAGPAGVSSNFRDIYAPNVVAYGASLTTPPLTITVNNVGPVVNAGPNQIVNEGDTVNLAPATFTDVGTLDTHTAIIDWGDGSLPVGPFAVSGGIVNGSHVYDDNGTYIAQVCVTDDDTGFDCNTLEIKVKNVAPTATFNTPTFVIAGDSFELSLTDPFDPSSADTAAGFAYRFDCGDGSGFTYWGPSNTATCSTDPDEVGVRTVKGRIRDKDGGVTEYTATVTVLPPSAATNSNLCYYDREPEIDGQQFTLIFTPDMQAWPAYKLPASNPGQFFYNVFYVDGGPASFDITIPEPFVTQGANPVHVYTDVEIIEVDGFKCFVPDPDSEIFAGDFDGLSDLTDFGGFLHIAVHLDFGLKGTTGYIPNANQDALDADDEITVLIPNLGDFTFAVSGSQTDSQTIQNSNNFKKIPGFGGLVTDGVDPVEGATVEIYLNGTFFDTATTDEDGWYMLVYKHTGKPAEFTVMLDGMEVSGILRSNKFVEASFTLP